MFRTHRCARARLDLGVFSVSCHSSGVGIRPHWHSPALYLVPPSCSPCSSFASRVYRGSSPLFADVRCTYVPSIASVTYSRCSPCLLSLPLQSVPNCAKIHSIARCRRGGQKWKLGVRKQ